MKEIGKLEKHTRRKIKRKNQKGGNCGKAYEEVLKEAKRLFGPDIFVRGRKEVKRIGGKERGMTKYLLKAQQ